MVVDLKDGHHQAIQERDNQIRVIRFENAGLPGEIQGKNQKIAPLQWCYIDYLANEDKSNGTTTTAKKMNQLSIPLYLYAGSMAIEGKRQKCRWHVIKVASYLKMKICQILLLV